MTQRLLNEQSHLCAVSTTSPVTDPQLVTIFLERPDPTHISETVFLPTVTLLSIPQYNVVGDVT